MSVGRLKKLLILLHELLSVKVMLIHCQDTAKRAVDRFAAWDEHLNKVRKSGRHSEAIKARVALIRETTGTLSSEKIAGRKFYGRGAREMFERRKLWALANNAGFTEGK